MKLDDIIEALNELAPLEVLRRDDGSYYCHLPGVEIGGDGFLEGPTEDERTPKAAILERWHMYTNLEPGKFLVLNAWDPKTRKELLWIDGKWTKRPSNQKGVRIRGTEDLVTE